MIHLVIDIGNTRAKLAVFAGDEIIHESQQINDIPHLIKTYQVERAIICSVGADYSVANALLTVPTLILNHETPLPFQVNYETPQTLGMDRVAGVAGAMQLFPNQSCLVIDAGTCITYDFISSDGIYSGGAISPGLHMRFKAMHEFTAKLPLPELVWPNDFEGKSTRDSLLSGVCLGLADEINGRIARYSQRFGPIQVIICGGDANLLKQHIKNNIFAAPSLVMFGLNQILKFNA